MAEPPAEQAILRHIEAVIEEEHRLCRQQHELTVTDPDRLDSLGRGKSLCFQLPSLFLPQAVRRRTPQAFMNDEFRVVIATKAFGLGIDKAHLRFGNLGRP